MSYSTCSPPTRSCFICSDEIIPFSENKSHRQFSEFAKDSGKTCELFLRVACRYLNLKCGDIKPEETIRVNDDNKGDNKNLLCENCLPLAESLCKIYREFKYVEQLFHWRMKGVIDLIQAQMLNHNDNGETPAKEKNDRINFRRKFLKREKENFKASDFPKLQLVRLKEICPKQLNLNSSKKPEEISQIPRYNEIEPSNIPLYERKEIEATSSDFNCKFCLKTFGSLHYLQVHENTAHKGNGIIHKCEVCGKLYNNKNSFRKHKLLHRGTTYPCLVCNKDFRNAWYLGIHRKRNNCKPNQTKTVANETPIKLENAKQNKGKRICRFCGKSFARNYNLQLHERTHSGIKPYQCKVCGKVYSHSANLTAHERGHSNIKPYQCAICGRKFQKNFGLKRHGEKNHPGEEFDLRKRKDFSIKCAFCDKVFTKMILKVNHEKSHFTEEQHFQCLFCVRRFRLQNYCDRHQEKCHGCVDDDTLLKQKPYNEAHVDAVIENVARHEDEGEILIVKVDAYDDLEYNNDELYDDEDNFILPD